MFPSLRLLLVLQRVVDRAWNCSVRRSLIPFLHQKKIEELTVIHRAVFGTRGKGDRTTGARKHRDLVSRKGDRTRTRVLEV